MLEAIILTLLFIWAVSNYNEYFEARNFINWRTCVKVCQDTAVGQLLMMAWYFPCGIAISRIKKESLK